MGVETLPRTEVETSAQPIGNGEFSNTVEYYRDYYDKIRQEDGDLFLAYVLGSEYQEERMQHGRRLLQRPYSHKQEVIASLLPEIKKDPELRKIFDTTSRLTKELYTVWGSIGLVYASDKEIREHGRKMDKLNHDMDAYREQILASSKSRRASEQR
jgi:hypothetical protein